MSKMRFTISGTVKQGQKIPAIKGLRTLAYIGLKEAKDSVENCEFEPLTFNISPAYEAGEGNIAEDISYLRSTGLTVQMAGSYELYADQLKEIATAAMLKGDYYVAKHLAAFLEKHF